VAVVELKPLPEDHASRKVVMTQQNEDDRAIEKLSAAELLPILYDELRRLAASLTAGLPPGRTLQPTALVHEAYLRLVKSKDPGWEGRRHFFGAAANAMREILIEQARRKASFKHGGQARRIELAEGVAWIEPPSGDLLALDEAIQQLQAEDARLGEIVQLRYYTGLTIEETADVLGASASTLKRDWRFARAWLARRLGESPP
jgi:RNA polymerase sigma factor (TIGR02999 family)